MNSSTGTGSSSSSTSNGKDRRSRRRRRRSDDDDDYDDDDNLELGLGRSWSEESDTSLFVKVYMEGQPIGRKLDMMAHSGYDHLIATLDQMFNASIIFFLDDHHHHSSLQHHHLLTYQDDEGDWLMIGDVPWELFLSSVKRLNISRA